MKIASLTKFKQGDIWKALKNLGWTQAELSRRSGLRQELIGDIINLKKKPSDDQVLIIVRTLSEHGEVLDLEKAWPDNFKGTKKAIVIEQYQDVSLLQIEDSLSDRVLITDGIHEDEMFNYDGIDNVIETLPAREQEVIKYMYYQRMNYYQCAKKMKLCHQRVRQIQEKALMRLRTPARIRGLLSETAKIDEVSFPKIGYSPKARFDDFT